MARIERFEDIQAWKKARSLTSAIYALSSAGEFSRDYGLRDQIRRAAVSVMSNIAEGFERGGDREFQQFLATAKGSLGELQSQLYVAVDAGFISRERFNQLYATAEEVARLIMGLMRYLTASDLNGSKYKDEPNVRTTRTRMIREDALWNSGLRTPDW